MSGPYAPFGQNFKLGIDARVMLNGNKVGKPRLRDEEFSNLTESNAGQP